MEVIPFSVSSPGVLLRKKEKKLKKMKDKNTTHVRQSGLPIFPTLCQQMRCSIDVTAGHV